MRIQKKPTFILNGIRTFRRKSSELNDSISLPAKNMKILKREETQKVPWRYSSYRTRESLIEIIVVDEEEKRAVVEKRIEGARKKEYEVLLKNEQYNFLRLYKIFNAKFRVFADKIETTFRSLDSQGTGMVSRGDFVSVFRQIGLDALTVTDRDLNLILSNLFSKKGLYSYREFLTNVADFNTHSKMTEIIREADLNFNDYALDFYYFMQQYQGNFRRNFRALFKGNKMISLNDFIEFCKSKGFILSHYLEYQYLFSLLSYDDSGIDLFYLIGFLSQERLSEREFLQNGKLKQDPFSMSKNKSDFYINDKLSTRISAESKDDSRENKNKNNYLFLKTMIDTVYLRLKEKNYDDIEGYFEDSKADITGEGNIPKEIFIEKLKKIYDDKISFFQTYLNLFMVPTKNQVRLTEFFSVYYLFYPKKAPKTIQNAKDDVETIARVSKTIKDFTQRAQAKGDLDELIKEFETENKGDINLPRFKEFLHSNLDFTAVSKEDLDIFLTYLTKNQTNKHEEVIKASFLTEDKSFTVIRRKDNKMLQKFLSKNKSITS